MTERSTAARHCRRLSVLASALVWAAATVHGQSYEFRKEDSWEATEKANPLPPEIVVPAKWLVSVTRGVDDIRFFYMHMPGNLAELSVVFRREKAPAGWTFAAPAKDGTLTITDPARDEWNWNHVFCEFESGNEELALFMWGCTDGDRLDLNDQMVIYDKWRKGPFTANEFRAPVLIRKGMNRVSFLLMRRSGKGNVQLAVRPLGYRFARLQFLMKSFPDDREHVGAAADQMLEIMRVANFSEKNPRHKKDVEAVYQLLRPRVEADSCPDQVLAAFIDFCVSYHYHGNGEMALCERLLAARKSLDPRLAVSAVRYHRYAGQDSRATELLKELTGARTVDAGWVRILYESCLDFRAHADGAEVMLALVERADKPMRARLTAYAGSLYEQAGEYAKALDAFEKVRTEDKYLQENILMSSERKCADVAVRAKVQDIVLPQPFGTAEYLTVIKNTIQSGDIEGAASDFAAKSDSMRDMVVEVQPGSAIDSFDYFLRQSETLPENFQKALRNLMRKQLEESQGGMERGDALRRSWAALQGKGQVNRLAVEEASRLLDQGNFDLAKAWYRAAWQAERDPTTGAGLAFAATVAGDPVLLQYLRNSLAPAEREATIDVAGSQTKLGPFVDQLAKGVASDALKQASSVQGFVRGWRARMSYAVKTAAGFPQKASRVLPGAPIRIIPLVHENTLAIFTGTHIEAFDLKTGARLWSLRTVTEIEKGDRGRPPAPVFRSVAQSGILICRVPRVVATRGGMFSGEYSLIAVNLKNGRMVWSRQNAVSDPTLEEGVLYHTEMESLRTDATLHAVAVDPVTGRNIWRRVLLTSNQGESIGGEVAPALVTPHGVLFSTSSGGVAMIHPLTGNVVWLRRYPRCQVNRWEEAFHISPALFADKENLIVMAPSDNRRIHALDAQTGKTVWEACPLRSPYLAGLWKGRLVTVGDAIRLLDVKTGRELAKSPIDLPPFPYPSMFGDSLALCGLLDNVSVDLQTLRVSTPALGVEPDQFHTHLLGKYMVSTAEDSFDVYGENKAQFAAVSGGESFDTAMLAFRKGQMPAKLPDLTDERVSSAVTLEDKVTFRMLAASAYRQTPGTNEALKHAAAILAEAPRMGSIPWLADHTLRPSQLAHRILDDGEAKGRPVKTVPPPPDSLPVLLWSRSSMGGRVSLCPEDRGVALIWDDENTLSLVALESFGEPLWKKGCATPVQSVQWLGDYLALRLTDGTVFVLDLYTGCTVLSLADAAGQTQLAASGDDVLEFRERRIVCRSGASGAQKWAADFPGGRHAAWVRRRRDKVYVIADGSAKDEYSGWHDWQLYRVDTENGRLSPPLFAGGRTVIPVALDDEWFVVRETSGFKTVVRDLEGNREIWRGTFTEALPVRRVSKQKQGEFLVGLCNPFDHRLQALIEPATGKKLIQVGADLLYYFNDDMYVLKAGKNVLLKVLGGVSDDKSDTSSEEFSVGLSDDMGGAAAASSSASEAEKSWVTQWEHAFDRDGRVVLDWLTGDLAVSLTMRDRQLSFDKVNLGTGKTTFSQSLIDGSTPFRSATWIAGARYFLAATAGEVYCFKMLEKEAKASFVADRRRLAGELTDAGERAQAARSIHFAEEILTMTPTVWCGDKGDIVRLQDASQWIPLPVGQVPPSLRDWRGKEDLNVTARFKSASDRIDFTIDVEDDYWQPFDGEAGGDCVSMSVPGLAFLLGMDASGRAVVHVLSDQSKYSVVGAKARMLSTGGVRYSFSLPEWRKNLMPRLDLKTGLNVVNLHLAVQDDDGFGPKGQLEWGPGGGRIMLK